MSEIDLNKYSPLEILQHLRNDYSDVIPDHRISGRLPQQERRYKVTGNWWMGVIQNLGLLMEDGLVPPGLRDQVEEFMQHYTKPEFANRDITDPADIQTANSLIDSILGK